MLNFKAKTGEGRSGSTIIVRGINSTEKMQDPKVHIASKPNILNFGTPIALLSIGNDDGTARLTGALRTNRATAFPGISHRERLG